MYKGKFKEARQKQIRETIDSLKEIKDRDFSNKVLKEITNKLIEISYNNNKTVLNTWNNNTIEPSEKHGFLEATLSKNQRFLDNEPSKGLTKEEIEERDKKYLEELRAMDTGCNISDNYLTESDSEEEVKLLIPNKKVK
jgi:hypothetical protein